MIETDLGSLRRTHYSNDLDPSKDGTDVTVMGWILSVRGHGNISFLTLRDKFGDIQIVAKKGSCPDEVREKISSLKEHSAISISGTIKKSEKSSTGIEIIPSSLRVFSEVQKIPPFEPQAKSVKNIDTRLELRPIDLRRKVLQHIFNARSNVLRGIRDYFYQEDFTEVNTPKMISTATEGGAALFPIFYYNKEEQTRKWHGCEGARIRGSGCQDRCRSAIGKPRPSSLGCVAMVSRHPGSLMAP